MAQQFWVPCLFTLFLAALAQESLGPQKAKVSNSPHPARDLNRFQHLISNCSYREIQDPALEGRELPDSLSLQTSATEALCHSTLPASVHRALLRFPRISSLLLCTLWIFELPLPQLPVPLPLDGCVTIRICSIPR